MKKKPQKPRHEIEAAEPRLLFSAGLEGVLATQSLDQQQEHHTAPIEQRVDAQTPTGDSPAAAELDSELNTELIFVDSDTPEYQTLIDDLLRVEDGSTRYEVVVLDNSTDGISQITETLGHYTNLSAVHILSHGSDGSIDLGGSQLDAEALAESAELVRTWSNAFSETGDLLIYGCNLAASDEGTSLVNTLSWLTGTDVAASDDLTGSALLGGDWDLEYRTGSVEASVALDAAAQSNYQGVLDTYVVSNTNATGAGSLYNAIENANKNAGVTDTITFNIPGAGPHTIAVPAGGLPTITDTVIIDGTTDPDFPGTPIIVLDGSGAGAVDGLILGAGSDGSTIRGLVINQFQQAGLILLDSDNHTIVGNYIGTDATGTLDRGNGNKGLQIENSAGNQVGGTSTADRNVIAANGDDGIILWGAGSTNNVIQGNYIGVDATGNAALGNGADGINISGDANNNTIGGDRTAGEGNVISGQTSANGDGIEIDNAGADNNRIYGNYIGTNFDGTVAIANARHGVVIYDGVQGTEIGGTGTGQGNIISGNTENGVHIDGNSNAATTNNTIQGNIIGLNAAGDAALSNGGIGVFIYGGANNTTIGGTTTTARNIISANDDGVRIQDSGTSNNTIIGNYIGTDITGMVDLGNLYDGIVLANGAQNNTIGGTTTSHRNLISGNDNDGIWITGNNTDNNTVQGNWIGLDAAGGALGNSYHGIGVENGASSNLIGGTDAGAGNTISYNAWDGIAVANGTGDGNSLLGNVISDNGGLGIDHSNDGVTVNDAGDGDTGPNSLQNYPVLASAGTTGTQITITGSLNSTANSYYRIEFFASTTGDASGHGEAETYLGFANVATDGSGNATINAVLTVSVADGAVITATATKSDASYSTFTDTSEFAANINATAATAASLWLTTEEDVGSPSGANGLDSWTGGSVLSFDDPNLAYDPGGTDGTLSNVFNLDNFVQDGDSRLDAVHYVGTNMTVGSNAISLQAGDILLSSVFAETLVNSDTSTLSVTSRDVFIFRPDNPSDYSLGGTFIMLINGADLGYEIEGITLVEQTTTVGVGGGATTLNPGDFLMTDRGTNGAIYHFQPGVLGDGATNTGTRTVLVDGTDLGINQLIHGVELVESDVTIGDRTLTSGQLLVSLYSDDTVSGTAVSRSDIFILNVTDTGTTTNATAEAFFTGGDIGFDNWQESPWAVSLVPAAIPNNAPTTSSITDFSVNEDAGFSFIDLNVIFDDAEDPDSSLVYTITSNTNPSLFDATSINGSGVLTLDYAAEQNGAADITIRATDTGGLFVETTFTVTVNAVNDAPVLTLPAGNVSYTEGAYQTIASTATLTDVDSANFDGGQLTVTIASGGEATDDMYIFTSGNVLASGVNLSYDFGSGNVLIGSISGGNGVGDPLIVSFNANATPAAIEDVIQQVYFRNTTDNPSTTSRVIDFEITDGDGGTSGVQSRTIDVTAVNDAPAGNVTITGTPTEDQVLTTDTSGITDPDGLGAFSYQWYRDGVAIASATASTYTLGDADVGTTITVAASYTDGGGTNESVTSAGVGPIANINDAPVISVDPSNALFLTDPINIDAALGVTDVDDTMLESAQIWFGDGYQRGHDRLTFTDQSGITGSFSVSTGVLTLTGTATVAAYEAALQSIEYYDANPTPAEGVVYVHMTVSDGADTSNLGTRVVEVVDNLPPRAGDDFGTVAEGGSTLIDLAANDTDWESTLDLTSIVITSGPSNGSIVINGDGTVTYTHDGSETTTDTFSYTINDNDGNTSSAAPVTITVTPVNDAPAVAINTGMTVAEGSAGTVITTAMLNEGDPDDSGVDITYTVTTIPANGTLYLGGVAISTSDTFTQADIDAGLVTYDHNGSQSFIDSFVFTMADGGEDGVTALTGQVFSITITNVNDAPTGIITDLGAGAEAIANTYSTGDQSIPAIASFADGSYIVVWESDGQDGSGDGIYAQRYAADGTTLGTEFRVNVETVDGEGQPTVATFADGGFVVGWRDVVAGSHAWVEARVFNADGTPATGDIVLKTGVMDGTNEAYNPAIVALDNSRFAVVWNGEQASVKTMEGAIFDRSGTNLSGIFTVGALQGNTGQWAGQPEITALSGGGFAVSWHDDDAGGTNPLSHLRFFDTNGSPVSSDILLGGDGQTDLVQLSDGNVAVVYGDGGNISAQIFTAAGASVVTEFQVNTGTAGTQSEPTITALADGGFYVAWQSDTGDADGSAILGQRFDASGNPVANERLLNQTETGDQTLPELVTLADGSVRAVWSSTTQDLSGETVVIRQLDVGGYVHENATNGTLVGMVTDVIDADVADTHTFSLVDDAGGAFAINSGTGEITVADGSLIDYETAVTMNITIRATDGGGLFHDEVVTINVLNVNETPVITSNGGGVTAGINVAENSTAVTTVTATDADLDTLTYSISGGADAALFSINSSTGELTFISAPNFENPLDADTNNVYEVTVRAADGNGGLDTQAISVTVTNVLELVVTNTNATGTGSLHEAILNANANVGVTDTITFNIGGGGAQTINVDAAGLPLITDSIILDATTQPGYSGTPLITLDGSATPAASGINGITIRANDSTVKGFIVINFADEGIEIDGSTGFGDNNTIQNNWVGIDKDGNLAGNAENGIMVSDNAAGNQIGGTGPNEGNVVGGNGLSGVIINENSDSNVVEGNLVGVKADGMTPAGNGLHGIHIQLSSDDNRIGGTTVDARNIIAANTQDGIFIDGTTDATHTTIPTGTVIQGNWIGTTGTGSTGVGNGNTGINVEGSWTVIGGTGANDGNVITNNGNEGINVSGAGATHTVIQGNIIGLDPDGVTGSGNDDVGIALLSGADNTTIGGTTAAARNIISNNFEGIEISSNDNIVQGNYIGTDISGTLDRGNRLDDGIEIKNSATGNLVGGTTAGAGNLIAFNALDGVNLVSGTDNTVIGNQIHSNSGLGIDLGTSGVTANDSGDADSGSNDLQNYPVITQADLGGTNLTVSGSLDTDGLNTQYRIDFYGNPAGTQDATNGEGRIYLGSTTVTTNGSGDATFSTVTLGGVTLVAGDYITATATEIVNPAQVGIDDQLAYGSTSEFSVNVVIVNANTAPTTGGISNVTVDEDAVDTVIDLFAAFADAEDADSSLTYTITGNTNAGLFNSTAIDGVAGSLTLDYAANANGTAVITVRATDTGGLFVETTFTVTVNAVNDAPVITSDGGGATATINVQENATAVSTVTATDIDGGALTYSLSASPDVARFLINSSTGELTFISAPDFENPVDAGADNVYNVTVQVSDGNGGIDTQSITVNVIDMADGIRVTPIDVVPIDGETLVNSTTTDNQQIGANVHQGMATDANGNYIVVWGSNLQDGSGWGIYGQRFSADGTPQGGEFLINTTTTDNQLNPAVAMDAAGNFVVTWQSNLQDGDNYGVYAQRFDAAGVAQGAEFLVNTTTTGYQGSAQIAMSASGEFVIAWLSTHDPDASLGVYAQRFDASGVAQGGEFQINTYTSDHQQIPSMSMDDAGNFVVTWVSENQDGSNYGVYGQLYDASGNPRGGEFQVNTTTVNSQFYSDVVMLPDGRFVVEYQSRNADGSFEVFIQRYAADGSTVGGELRVNTTTVSSAQQPIGSITADESGNITVVWNSDADGAGTAVVGQRLDWAGNKLGGEFIVNTTTSGNQTYPEVIAQAGGGFIVAWSGNGAGDADGVFMQRYGLAVSEEGGSATFQIVLESAPTADVTIPISVSDPTEGTVSVGSITFTTGDWSTPQTVTINGVQDFTIDGDQVFQVILGAATSADPNFNGLDLADLTVLNTELPNQAPTGLPAITGTVEEDQVLTADTSGISDPDGLGAFSYQWYRDGVAIGGATASTYTLGDADVGSQIHVEASYTDVRGSSEGPLASAQTGPVANINDAPTGSVTISGTPTEDQTLTASNTLADADGLGAISYQWYRDGVAISGATGTTYTLGDADVGTSITVRASYNDAYGQNESVSSAGVGPVANINDLPAGIPVITGTATEDQTLTADTTGISDADGLGAFSYQWYRDGVAIGGATAGTYTLGDADVGASITVEVSYTDGHGTGESVTSAGVGPVTNVNDPVVGNPVITGTVTEDQTLTADTSGVSDADGLGAFSYQWYRDGVAIGGATGVNYTLGDADVGANITVEVSYLDGQGTSESVTSAGVGPVANINDAPTGSVTISGLLTEDQMLTASNSLSDLDGLGIVSYQWYRDGVAISGATGGAYTLGDADVGATITVTASYVDGHGTSESVTSAGVGPISNVNDLPVGSVTISGTPTEDQTLTAANTLADADGLGIIGYQWYRDGVAIGGATASTYTLGDLDVGASITVEASYVDAHGTSESVTSAAVGPVANVNDAVAGVPVITGTPTEDQTLTADTTGISDADGLGAFSYQWYRDGVAVGGATGTTYILGGADVGTTITVEVSYTDGHGTGESVTSAGVGPVTNVNDPVVGNPVITGTVTEDQTLTADTSGISDADGLGAFSYQWYRDGVAIGGATGVNYTLGDADVGANITVEVSYLDGQGTSESTISAAVGPVANVNDAVAGAPVITGTPTEDQTLTADTTGISDADGLGAFSYQWYRDGVLIGGATGVNYTLGDADVGATITVEVSYTDVHGTGESTTSAGVGPVANVNDAPTGSVTISGIPTEDQTLTAGNTLADADGMGVVSWQWYRDGVAIGGATGSTYTLDDADVGGSITVVASYTDGHGTSESMTSAGVGPIASVNDLPVGAPTITGTVTEDQTLTADTSGVSDADGLGAFSYQWYRDGAAIGGATASTYTLGDADVNALISVQVSYTDGQGTAESITSAQTGAVANVNDLPVGLPTVSGTATEDQVLTADTSGISDADGLGAFGYQWYRDGVAIGGATGSTYTLGDADVGTQISVQVSYIDVHGTSEGPLASAQTGAVVNINDAPTGSVTISGTPTEDQTLTAGNTLADADGMGVVSYQWYRDGVAIGGATASTYTLGDADVGASITVAASYTDGHGTGESVTSAAVGPIANVNDAVTGAPVITGTPAEDQTLTVDTTGISDADGLGAFSYQWYRDGVAIGGATGVNYILGNADVGATITVEVSYTDGHGTGESVTSAGVGPVTNVNDPVVGNPVITGTPTEDQVLTADTSGISDADGLGAFGYQWYRDGVAIGGATGVNYTLGDADVGATVTVEVSYLDGQGTSESTMSAGVGPVANINDAVAGAPVITGTPTEDQTLTADTTGISDADGLGAFSYQWYRDGVAIGGATASTYTLGDLDVGASITVEASYVDAHGTSESVTSAAVGPIANVNDAVAGAPVITGTPTEDQTLTADTTGISDADGLGAFSYQWYRDGVLIGGATGVNYTLDDADVGASITVEVSYTDGHGTGESVSSAAVGPVANVNDAVAGAPVITGTQTEDQTLTADTSGISDADGLGAFSYQWYRDGVVIGGATASTYTLGDADVGTNITVEVSYLDGQGTNESTTSVAVGPIANVNDAVAGAPVITGTPAEYQTLTADTTGISDADGLGAFSYQWYRDGVAIGGATGTTYILGGADVGTTITVEVSYTDGHGTGESVTSAGVGPVTNVNDPVVGNPVITGTVTEDQVLTADTSGISDADGLGVFSYQWYRDGVAIGGATGVNYTLGDADVGTNITVEASYTDGHGTSESTTSAAVGPVANVNDVPTGSITISGIPTEDQTLTAGNTLADADGMGVVSWQWYRDGVMIGGANGSTYTLGDADVGATITVEASYTDGHGTGESVISAGIGPVANVNDAVAGAPVITGTPTEDQTLTADTTGISDADGLGAFSYQWYRDGVAIGGATAATYTLDDADVGTNITVEVSYTDGHGTGESVTSTAVGPVANVNDAPTGSVTISGTPTEDQTLTAGNTLADADGMGVVSYQWYRDGIAIGGATAGTYTLGDADVGATITVEASYTDGHGTNTSVMSLGVGPIANINDVPAGLPVITGTPTEDQVLTADTTGISDADGLGAFSFQWYRDGVAIGGATAGTYTLGDADVGTTITVTVSYTDGHGMAESVTSAGVGPVVNVNDAVSGAPVITGTPTEDQVLTADTTGIADADGLGAFSYQWLRDGVAIGGATAATYTLNDADVGANITVAVSYIDGHGTGESVTSAAVGPIANVNDAPTGSVTISGTPTEDQTLTAGNTLADADGMGVVSYQWYRDGIAIGGATAGTYTLGDADVGTTITVEASYIDGYGTSEVVTSAGVGPIANVNDAVTGTPVITGTPTEDQVLTAGTTGISDADGLGAFSYQWFRDGVAIVGATGVNYTLGDADVGASITVAVSYTDGNGTAESVTSASVGPIANINDAPAGVPTINGLAQEDQVLTADTGTISDADGLGAFSYQWLRNGVAIAGETAVTYTLGDADVGAQISVEVSYTDSHGMNEGPLVSAQTGPVLNVNDAPAGTVLVDNMSPMQGDTLTASNTLTDADGLSGAISYQWFRDGVAIAGANGATYTTVAADAGAALTVVASYVDDQGTAESVSSSATTGVQTATADDEVVTIVTAAAPVDDDDGTTPVSAPQAGPGTVTGVSDAGHGEYTGEEARKDPMFQVQQYDFQDYDYREDGQAKRFSGPVMKMFGKGAELAIDLSQLIDLVRMQMSETDQGTVNYVFRTVGGVTLSLSAGLVTWLSRGSAIAATMVSSVPILKGFDPLPIMKTRKEEEDSRQDADSLDDSVDDMFEGRVVNGQAGESGQQGNRRA